MAFEQPKLPYAEDALEPVLSAYEVQLHYGKHAAKYFDTTNELIKGTVYDRATKLEELVNKDSLTTVNSKLFNNACQAWNHTFYFNCLAPETETGECSDELMIQIEKDFGDFDTFKQKFNELAINHFASGWAWLIWKTDKLIIKTTPNARNPLTDDGQIPLLCVDLWEHSYLYMREYAADRKAYVHALWKIINWKFVNQQFAEATK